MENEHPINPREIRQFMDRKVTPYLFKIGLTPSNGPFIAEINDNEGISQSELSYNLNVDKALTTRTVRHLIEKGFVEDRSKESHRYSLYLTEKGKDAAKIVKEAIDSAWESIYDHLTEDEVTELKRIFDKIGELIRKELRKGADQ